MKRPTTSIMSLIRGACMDRRGVTALIVATTASLLVAFTSFALDVGNAVAIKHALQASADAAAIAGAQQINVTGGTPVATATTYSSVAGSKNAIPGITATMVSGYPALACFQSTGIAYDPKTKKCTGSSSANGIVVKQQATVPTFFSRALGPSYGNFTVTVTATASAAGGSAGKPFNIMFVLDTTASMANPINPTDKTDPCYTAGLSKIACALEGVNYFLDALNPATVQVGLVVFPPLQSSSQITYDTDCNPGTNPKIAAYNQTSPGAPVYLIAPLTSGYRTTINTPLPLLSTAITDATGAACGTSPPTVADGVTAPGGVGTYYADAITAAQAQLPSGGNSQNAIIVLSDGDANAKATNINTTANPTKVNNQCQQGVTAASTAAGAGTWVFSIAYNALTSGSCTTDTGLQACTAMQNIASDSSKFFAVNDDGTTTCKSTSGTSLSSLLSAFNTILGLVEPVRLLPDNTT